jgi:hypothetical protein
MLGQEIGKDRDAHSFLREFRQHANRVCSRGAAYLHRSMFALSAQFPVA